MAEPLVRAKAISFLVAFLLLIDRIQSGYFRVMLVLRGATAYGLLIAAKHRPTPSTIW